MEINKIKNKQIKINDTKSWFSEKTNKMDKPLARLIRNKKMGRHKLLVSGMKEGYHNRSYRKWKNNKGIFENSDEVETFQERYKLPKLIQQKVTGIPLCVYLGPCGFTGEFNQIYEDEIMPILYKIFQKTEENTVQFILWSQHYPDIKTKHIIREKQAENVDLIFFL